MKKLISLLCSLLLLLPLAVSCDGVGEDTTASDSTSENPAEPSSITVIEDGVSNFLTIRPDITDDGLLNEIIEWRRALDAKYGVRVEITTDWAQDNRENNTVESSSDVHEILIGDTNRAESRAIKEEHLLYCGFVIKVTNGKLVIWGSDDLYTARALDYFCENLLSDGSLVFRSDFCYIHDINGEGTPVNTIINDYNIVYATGDTRVKSAAIALGQSLTAMSGTTVKVLAQSASSDSSKKEILIGETDREASKSIAAELDYMDYTVRADGESVVVLGGSPLSTLRAIDTFIYELQMENISSLDSYEYDYVFRDVVPDSIAWDPDSFTPAWSSQFTPPEWMLDFDEKIYACVCPTGRMTSDSHRGDVQFYPENSLEGILSAAMMGADVIEIDPRMTKDHVMVLMHDATLGRTTNFNDLKGKNGLPSSNQIKDWTYEQLLELNLLYNGEVTEYKIPTLYEVVRVLAGRCQIHLDVKVDTINKDADVYRLADELGAKECFFYYYGIGVMRTWLGYNKDDAKFSAFVDKANKYVGTPGFGQRKRNFDMIAQYGDNAAGWKKQYDNGCKMVFTNKIYDISRYIAENESALIPQ